MKSKNFFVWLGTALSPQLGLGPKAAYLDRAAAAGLPVPGGVIVLDELFGESLRRGWLQEVEGDFILQNPAALEQALNLPAVSARLAVRSAFAVEDGPTKSLAGYFDSILDVAPQDVSDALCKVWRSSLRHDAPRRRDVIVMSMVDAQQAGVAVTETDQEDDLINVTEGLADGLVGGRLTGETCCLPKLNAFESPTENGFAGRVQVLLRDVRRVFGPGNWDVEFADDGRCCWLLQVRPLTRPVTRNEWFTYANHREILPPLPSRLMTSVIAACANDLFEYYRSFDARLPANRPFIEVFAGRPFINLSLLADMMRLWGLPTRLVTDAIGGRDVFNQGLRWGRLLRSLPVLARLGWAQLQSVGSAEKRINWLAQVGQAPSGPDSFTGCLADLQMVYTALVREMFSLTQAISGPLAVLRRLGLLAEWAARHETITTRLMTDLDPLREYVQAHPAVADAIRQGDLPDEEGFQRLWQDYLARYGFRGIFESDIAQPRYHEQPATLLESLRLRRQPSVTPPLPWSAWLAYPVWWQARRALDARERLRHAAMQTFDRIRQRLKCLAKHAYGAGTLPAAEDVWLLEVGELKQLDGGWRATPDFLAHRRQEQAQFAEYDFPDVFQRFDDFTAFRVRSASDMPGKCLQGIGLTRGRAEGRAWVCDTPTLPPKDTGEPYILVARAVDAGWIPVFAAVAGVVVEIGGDLSHGSIVLRELGLPSVTNVRGVTRVIQTGDWICVQASEGAVDVLASGIGEVLLASAPARE